MSTTENQLTPPYNEPTPPLLDPAFEVIEFAGHTALLGEMVEMGHVGSHGSTQSPRPKPIVFPKLFYIQDVFNRYLTLWRWWPSDADSESNICGVAGLFDSPSLKATFSHVLLDEQHHLIKHTSTDMDGYLAQLAHDDQRILGCTKDEDYLFEFVPSQGNSHVLVKCRKKWMVIDTERVPKCPVVFKDWIGWDSFFKISPAATELGIYDVEYDLEHPIIELQPSIVALRTHVSNPTDVTVHRSIEYSYTHSKVGTWNGATGVSVGFETTFKAGVPFLDGEGIAVNLGTSYQHLWGGQECENEIVNQEIGFDIPPRSSKTLLVVVRRSKLNVQFSYKFKALWKDGSTSDETKSGVYENVESYQVDVNLYDSPESAQLHEAAQ